ncbi:glycosyltransferase family 2 protein [candidate division KSB1 bacterium]|nr:glycosyltransferase family 2 protein [candidate division KSB1 bacterium]
MSISVILITLNEEKNIDACLQSVQWADEIVVVDSFSTDRTIEIVKNYTDKVILHPFDGYAENKNLALDRTTSEWILWLDADERVTPELSDEIKHVLNKTEYQGFEMPRKAFFLGRWIKHCGWYPGYVLRLFRKQNARFSHNKVHEGLILDGSCGRLTHALLHYTDDSLEHYLWKFNRYTSLAAEELHERGRRAGLGSIIFRPVFAFLKMYFMKRGFLDGIEGLMLCLLSAGYVAVKYAKTWELGK